MGMVEFRTLAPVGASFGTVIHGPEGTVIAAGPGTDAFAPPDGGAGIDRLPGLRLPVAGPRWSVAVRVAPGFTAAFDAGALMLRTRGASWAKLAYERAPDGRTMAVSVVTRALSDDANGPVFDLPALWLRAVCTGPALAFHVSDGGGRWDLLRVFALPDPVTAVDLVAQSPTGQGCRVAFDGLTVTAAAPADLRDGS